MFEFSYILKKSVLVVISVLILFLSGLCWAQIISGSEPLKKETEVSEVQNTTDPMVMFSGTVVVLARYLTFKK